MDFEVGCFSEQERHVYMHGRNRKRWWGEGYSLQEGKINRTQSTGRGLSEVRQHFIYTGWREKRCVWIWMICGTRASLDAQPRNRLEP